MTAIAKVLFPEGRLGTRLFLQGDFPDISLFPDTLGLILKLNTKFHFTSGDQTSAKRWQYSKRLCRKL